MHWCPFAGAKTGKSFKNKKSNSVTTSELFQRHFGDSVAVDLKHPNTESFFNELSDRCKEEDRIKAMAIQTIPAIEADEGEG